MYLSPCLPFHKWPWCNNGMGTTVHLQCRNKVDKNIDTSLNVEELRHAEETCLRFSQQESFAQELKNLKQDRSQEKAKYSNLVLFCLKVLKMREIWKSNQSRCRESINSRSEAATENTEQTSHQGQETEANQLRQRFWI